MKKLHVVLLACALVLGAGSLLLKADPSDHFVAGAKSFTAQTTALSGVTVFTPSDDRTYLITVWTDVVSNSSSAMATANTYYTEVNGNTNTNSAGAGASGASAGSGATSVSRVKGGTAVTLNTTWSPAGSSPSYNVYVSWVGQ